MLGYIVPDKPELKLREFELYSGYYCGICRSIGRRYGQLPRLYLSYDSVFLALLVASLDPAEDTLQIDRCIVHPMKKRPIISGSRAADYAADMQLLLMYHKLRDDYQDERKLVSAIGARMMRRLYRKLAALYPKTSAAIESELAKLARIERDREALLDRSSEPYARIMETVFRCDELSGSPLDAGTRDVLGRIGFNVGKWVYTIDAYDDIDDNMASGAYNPLLLQFEDPACPAESARSFCERIASRIDFSLTFCLAELAGSFGGLMVLRNKELLENIIYFGLRKKTEDVLKKGSIEEDAESI